MRIRDLVTGLAFAVSIGGSGAARAEQKNFETSGAGLALVGACARHVTVAVDPALSGHVTVTADAVHQEEIDQIAVATADGQARVGLRLDRHECWTPQPNNNFDRTLTLAVHVPGRFPVSVEEGGLGDYALGAVGPLTISLSGLMTVRADRVDGDLQVDSSGAGRIDIGRIEADRVDAALSGMGVLHVGDGRIGALVLSDSGAGTVQIDPVVDSARLEVSGVGSITLGGVRGTLRRDVSGMARITIAGKRLTETEAGGDGQE